MKEFGKDFSRSSLTCYSNFLPKLYAQNEIDNGELVAIDMKDNPFLNRGTYLVYSKNNQNQNFKYFIDFTKEFFK